MNKVFVKVAMGFTFGFLFCLLFGTVGLGINTWINHNQSTTEVEVIGGDTISIYSVVDIVAVTFSTKNGMILSHKNQEISLPAGKNKVQVEVGEYTVLRGKGFVSTNLDDKVFNDDDLFRKMRIKKIITSASLLFGFILGFVIGVILNKDEKSRQKFIGE